MDFLSPDVMSICVVLRVYTVVNCVTNGETEVAKQEVACLSTQQGG